jgi:hypothetical protein
MRTSMAYFAGVGTVVGAIAAGLGGGLVISGIMNPQTTRELSKVELHARAQQSPQPGAVQSQQTSPQSQSAQNDSQKDAPVSASNTPQPYLAQIERASAAPVVVTPAPQNSPQQQPPQQQPQREAANAPLQSAAPQSVASSTAGDQPAKSERAKPENAYAKAREADVKRLEDKRKGERRQQSTMRRQQQLDQDPRDAEEQVRVVRADREPREIIVRRDDSDRPDFDRPRREDFDSGRPMIEFPRINLFGQD